MALTISNDLAAAQIEALSTAADAGTGPAKIIIYSGSRPASPDTAIGAQVALVTFPMGDPAFGAAGTVTGGQRITAAAVADATAAATGTAAWFRLLDSDDTAISDGTVTVTGGGGDCELSAVAITSGGDVQLTSATFRQLTGV